MAVALLVAAGTGERLGAGRPKAFVVLAGHSLLQWSVAALRGAPSIRELVIAVPAGEDPGVPGAVVVEGGATRSESVRNALAAASDVDEVVVHDAARPLARPELFEAVLAGLDEADCAIAAAPIADTVKEAGPDRRVVATLDRSRLWAIQTPQAFRRDVLERALAAPPDVLTCATDDAWLVERFGGSVLVVESGPENFKVTTPHDLRVAELLLGQT